MPEVRELTPEELQGLENQGIDPTSYKGKKLTLYNDDEASAMQQPAQQPTDSKDISALSTVGRTAKAHGGGWLGGGAAGLGTAALLTELGLAPETGGLSLLPMIATAGAAIAGGYGGEKLQEKIQGKDLSDRLNEEAQAAAAQHPLVAGATDIAGSMLAGGGKPSLSVLPKAIGGDANATRTIIGNALLNPAINTGLNYAITGEAPSLGDLAAQAGSGLITDNAKWANRITGHGEKPNAKESTKEEQSSSADIEKGEPQDVSASPFMMKGDDGEHLIDSKSVNEAYKKNINTKPSYEGMDDTAKYIARTSYERNNRLSVDEKRQALHDKWVEDYSKTKSTPETTVEPTTKVETKEEDTSGGEMPQYTNPLNGIKQAPEQSSNEDYQSKLSELKDMMKNGDTSSPEFLAKWKEVEDIKNKNGGKVPTKESPVSSSETLGLNKGIELQKHIQSGDATIGSTLKIIGETKGNHYSDLANYFAKTSSKEKLDLPVKYGEHLGEDGNPRSHYAPSDKQINLAFSDVSSPYTILHEVGHALLYHSLPTELEGLRGAKLHEGLQEYLAKKDGDSNVKELISSYLQAAKTLGLHDSLFTDKNAAYVDGKNVRQKGMAGAPDEAQKYHGETGYFLSDLHEFTTAVMHDRTFQKKLNEMPSGLGDGKSLWSRLAEAIRNILGVPVKDGSLLERVLKANENIIKGEKGEHNEARTNRDLSTRTTDNSADRIYQVPAKRGGKEVERESSNPLGFIGRMTQASIDKVRDIPKEGTKITASSKEVGDSIQLAHQKADELKGAWSNKIAKAGAGLTDRDKESVRKAFIWENENKGEKVPSTVLRTPAARQFYNVAKEVFSASGKHQLDINEPVYRNGKPTELKQMDNYNPFGLSQKVAEIYRANTDVEAIKKLDADYLANAKKFGYGEVEAKKALTDFKKTIQGDIRQQGGNMQWFSGVRKAHGIPLPESFAKEDVVRNLVDYYNRRASDNAFYEHIESNPRVMSALGESKDAWGKKIEEDPTGGIIGNTAVREAIKEFQGEIGGQAFHTEKGISNLATSLFIAWPGLEMHKVLSNVIGLTNYVDNPAQLTKLLSHVVTHVNEGIEHAEAGGRIKLRAGKLADAFDSNATMAQRLNALAQGVRNISSLGGLTDKWSNGLLQAGAEWVLPNKIEKANAGDRTSQQLLKKLDPTYEVGKRYDKDSIIKLANSFAGFIHGTGDGRTMPAWMMGDSEFSGFFKLAHWSIAQTNRFMTDVINPAKSGDYKPLVTSLFGAAVGGYIIKELREQLAGKKSQIPSLSEIANSDRGLTGNAGPLAYNLIAATQYAGFGGLLSQAMKYPFDFIYKNTPQGATFPMDEIASDLASTLKNVSSAIANDPHVDYGLLVQHVMQHVLTTDVQLGRMAFNQGVNSGVISGTEAEKKKLTDKLGQLRRFNIVEGLPYEDASAAGSENPYTDLEAKKFKMTTDPKEIAKQLPKLINNYLERYKDNPDILMQKLKGLKESQYATFPNIETTPLSFAKYLNYLTKEEGPEKAQNALMDYFRHKAINEARSSVVP